MSAHWALLVLSVAVLAGGVGSLLLSARVRRLRADLEQLRDQTKMAFIASQAAESILLDKIEGRS
jgi:hypothetical protein